MATTPAVAGATTGLGKGSHQSNRDRGLSPRMAELLRRGDLEGRYKSRSEVLMALLAGMIQAGWSQDRALRALQDPRNSGGESLRIDRKGRPLSIGRALRKFRRDWDKAEAWVSSLPAFRNRYDVVEALLDVRAAADEAKWPGRAGATDRVVLGALLDIAMAAGRTEIHASTRTVAAAIGCSPDTASKALKRLRKAGWIGQKAKSRAALAARWTIKRRNRTGHSGLGNDTSGPENLLVDAFCWAGLGWSKGRVYAQLGREVVTTSTVAMALQVGDRTVRKHLAVLRTYGLAERVMDGWVRGPAEPAEVAQLLGTEGRQRAQEDDFRRSRRQFRGRTVPPGVDPETGEVRNRTGHAWPTHGVTECPVEFRPLPELEITLDARKVDPDALLEALKREGMVDEGTTWEEEEAS